jgi:hypothetical protein
MLEAACRGVDFSNFPKGGGPNLTGGGAKLEVALS